MIFTPRFSHSQTWFEYFYQESKIICNVINVVFSVSPSVLQLRKAVMDHISDSFLETNVPLLVLIEAAKSGNEKEVKEYAQVFREHANKLVEVSNELYTLLWSHTATVVTILITV